VKPKKERSMFEQVSTFRKTPGEVAAKSIQLSSMFDRFAAETEFLDFLYNLVRLVKPVHSVERGARNGRSAIAIASALRHNGLGHLVSLEDDPEAARHAMAEIGTAQLEGWVAVVTEQILNFQPRNELQFVLLDSDFGVRADEFRHLCKKLASGAIVVFHDSTTRHAGMADAIIKLTMEGRLARSCVFPTPPGVFVCSVQPPANLSGPTLPELLPKAQDLRTKALPYKQAAILVVGVHRSGTSCLAHLLHVLGAKLPAQVIGPGHGNSLGHWEPMRLMRINKEILSAIGRTWYDPRPIPPSWFRSKEAYVFHERLVAEIALGYEVAPLILIKDPRICRLLPLYLDVLDALEIEPLIILPIRHPGEVIRSIHERDHIDPSIVDLLWLRSLVEAEEASRTCARVWISFDQLLDDWEATVRSIADQLGIVWPNGPQTVASVAASIVRRRHQHYRMADDPTPFLPAPLTIHAWQAAQQGLNGNEEAARAAFDRIRASITEVDHLNEPQQESIQNRLGTVETNCEPSKREIDSMQARIYRHLTWPIRWLHRRVVRTVPFSSWAKS
jgi:predicted O-methyltransferase YrrM